MTSWWRWVPRRRQFSAVAKFIGAAASTASTAYLGGVGLKLYGGSKPWETASICADAAVAFVASARAAYYEVTKPNMDRRDALVRATLEAAWYDVADHSGIDTRQLLVSLFLVEGPPWKRQLVRFMRVGVKQIPESPVTWTKGKGAIGEAWATSATARQYLGTFNAKGGVWTPDKWTNAGGPTKTGLPFGDWVATRRKYDMVIAVPIHRGNQFMGCVAATGPKDNTTWLADPLVEESLATAARIIAVTSHL